ncbi:MobQ family relaxase [Paracoccus benzoatiresistens]|uniref:MobA/MobL family protein n=1 Tax=Paracoccus benzoatiresistens TaxID=2997341 RepID=A0ABT4JB69_9RHOB|nr:MobQ family relaxase [Paracoccus sp. EF6]MCZ0964380.1 MobA/MobL family protein [Paracoccus sp. EF6]
MAIFHLRATMISRSAGRSATGAAAYRSGERIHDERTGLSFDYRARGGVEHVEILAPERSPEWVRDRAALWNAVERAETRKNSQVAREIRVALPAELDRTQRIALVRDFCQRSFVDRGMVADIALHAPGREGDERNHHAHILLTTREIGQEGFSAKNRDWNAKDLLEDWREAWARDSNYALERCGHEARIDHRTLETQREEALERSVQARERGDEAEALRETVRAVELDRRPLPQLSLGAWQLKERGIEVAAVQLWREVKAQAVEVARVAERLSGQVREWLGRTVERLAPGHELTYAGPDRGAVRDEGQDLASARHGRRQTPERVQDAGSDIAARLRVAREAHQDRGEVELGQGRTPESAKSLAERLREAARTINPAASAERAARLQQERLAEERQRVQEAERVRERERRGHDRSWGHEL